MARLVFASATLLVEKTALEGHEGLVVTFCCLLHTSDELHMKRKEHYHIVEGDYIVLKHK